MFLTRSEYDRGVNTFSPEGRLFQVEYAIEAIKLGSTAIGIQTSEGVCLAVEKRITSPPWGAVMWDGEQQMVILPPPPTPLSLQVSHGPLGDVCPVRCQSHRLRFGRRPELSAGGLP
uniref:Proteasome 20S subunit alpha 5 n=1 Tax=Calidris pygmaea TaxID=425635 RepID=A0A8C3JRJ4_9CHAR